MPKKGTEGYPFRLNEPIDYSRSFKPTRRLFAFVQTNLNTGAVQDSFKFQMTDIIKNIEYNHFLSTRTILNNHKRPNSPNF